MRAAVIALIAAVSMSGAQAPAGAPKYERVYTLKPREGVFAYARIAPDGNQLVYASRVDARNPTGPQGYLETIVELKTGRVLFSESGIDAYWSLDGKRLIWSADDGVGIRHNDTGEVSHRIAPNNLGDYYSWAVRDGRDLILTIDSKYYYLDGNKAVMPAAGVKDCGAPFGTGERPLISKDGKRITTFVKGNIVVRGLDNCDDIFDTGIQGAKADFSWDGRYIAFHALKKEKTGYEIKIVDVQQKTVRTLPGTIPPWILSTPLT